ncbi:MAG: acyl-CoA dehydrogenase family protein [Thermoanaerobaculia bacterium]
MESPHELSAYTEELEKWLGSSPRSLLAAAEAIPSFPARVEALSDLMKALFDEGWGRYGWPEDLGGLGGTILHRAALWDSLARHGVRGMGLFEHVEILMPTLCAMAPRELMTAALPGFLSGRELWAQGFSEPEAGSDLASLRTRASGVEGGYVLRGRKIWTSWASYATWCLVLGRTGTPESRHRGLTAFIVDLREPGVQVNAIEQANGTDELAEVALDDVFVPADRVVGAVDRGWNVAMHILSSERGTFAWFRHCFLYQQLLSHLDATQPCSDGAVGDALLDLAAVSATSYLGLESHEADLPLGPRAAFTKLLLCESERAVHDLILADDADLAVGVQDAETACLRQDYLFSRIVTIYGGSQQMQLETIAKQLLRLP